jgi:hypothetical protein
LDGASPSIAGITYGSTATGCNIVQGTGGTLHLQNATGPATIVVGGGQQTIACPVQLDSNLTVSPVLGSTLTITGPISGSGSLTLNDRGKLVLSGANSLTSVTVTSGVLVLDAANSIADGASLTVGAASAFNSPTVSSPAAAPLASVVAASAPASSAAKSLSPRAVAAVMAVSPSRPRNLTTDYKHPAVAAGFPELGPAAAADVAVRERGRINALFFANIPTRE